MWLLKISVISVSLMGHPHVQSQTIIRTTQSHCEDLAVYISKMNVAKNAPGTAHVTSATCEKE